MLRGAHNVPGTHSSRSDTLHILSLFYIVYTPSSDFQDWRPSRERRRHWNSREDKQVGQRSTVRQWQRWGGHTWISGLQPRVPPSAASGFLLRPDVASVGHLHRSHSSWSLPCQPWCLGPEDWLSELGGTWQPPCGDKETEALSYRAGGGRARSRTHSTCGVAPTPKPWTLGKTRFKSQLHHLSSVPWAG